MRSRRAFWNWDEIYCKICRKSTVIRGRIQGKEHLRNNFPHGRKNTKPVLNSLRIWTVEYAGKNFGGGGSRQGVRPRRGSGGGAPRTRENFRKLAKIPEENCKNCCIVGYFAKKLQNHALNFRAFGRKTQLVGEILRKF